MVVDCKLNKTNCFLILFFPSFSFQFPLSLSSFSLLDREIVFNFWDRLPPQRERNKEVFVQNLWRDMNRCELCKGRARLHCASDQASLCWDCDAKVHSANFLVARHFRNLLCHVCQSPMPWSASGVKLGPTISVCEKCVVGRGRKNAESDEEEEAAEEDQQEEIQVVPWSPPPAVEESTCTSIGDGDELISRKRIRIENASSPDLQLV